MKTRFAILYFLGSSICGFSQDKNFDLSKYKFPDYKRHELEFNFNSNGNRNRTSDVQSNLQDVNSFRISSNSHSSFSLDYLYENFTRKKVDYLSSTLSGDFEYNKNRSQGITNRTYNPELRFNLDGYRRSYLGGNNLFLETSTYFYNHFYESKITYSDSREISLMKNNHLYLYIGFGLGIGRMEKVSDLWQAYYILEKLKEQKTIGKDLTTNDIYNFADHVSKLKNKRFFDARLRKIAELQSLDSLLHNNGLIESTDINYFTTLNDYWSYGSFQGRESGRVIKLKVTPNYSRTLSKHNSNTADVSNETNLNSSLTFYCNKQLNLLWERLFNIGIFSSTVLNSTGVNSENLPKNLFQTETRLGYGFYPDSRTSLKLFGGYSGRESRSYNPQELKYWSNTFSLFFVGNYYISQRLQVTGTFDLNYITFPKNSNSSTYTQYNLGLRYAIF